MILVHLEPPIGHPPLLPICESGKDYTASRRSETRSPTADPARRHQGNPAPGQRPIAVWQGGDGIFFAERGETGLRGDGQKVS
jgi:hypothetical protein